jgi:acetylglutamate kinase
VKLTLLKLGGELLENEQKIIAVARTIARAAGPLVVVHGGG